MYCLLCLILGGIGAFWLLWRFRHRRMISMSRMVPGPPTLPFIGNANKFICQPEELIRVIKELMEEYGDVVTFWLGPDLNYLISNPDDLKMLLSNPKFSIKGPQYKYIAEITGEGILGGSGPQWRKHRKIISPNYSKRVVETYASVFNKETDILLEKLRDIGPQKINIYKYIVKTTSYSVCQTLMGLTKDQTLKLPHLQDIIDKTPRIYGIGFKRMTQWYLQIDPVFWMTKFYQEQKKFYKMTKQFSQQIIKHRQEMLNTMKDNIKEDLLYSEERNSVINSRLSVIDRYILSKQLKNYDLIMETFTVFTSSQEASAKISSFIISMMAYHPKCQERLYEEINRVLRDTDRPVMNNDLKQMPYLDNVFKEVVRLFPIGVMLQRTIREDIKLSSCTLPAGCSIVAPIYHLHRDPRYWEKPDSFDPDRFTLENMKNRNPNCYLPFSWGPMDCLGRYFGIQLVKTIVVKILKEFEVTSPEKYEDMRVIMAISAESRNGHPVFLHPRKKN